MPTRRTNYFAILGEVDRAPLGAPFDRGRALAHRSFYSRDTVSVKTRTTGNTRHRVMRRKAYWKVPVDRPKPASSKKRASPYPSMGMRDSRLARMSRGQSALCTSESLLSLKKSLRVNRRLVPVVKNLFMFQVARATFLHDDIVPYIRYNGGWICVCSIPSTRALFKIIDLMIHVNSTAKFDKRLKAFLTNHGHSKD